MSSHGATPVTSDVPVALSENFFSPTYAARRELLQSRAKLKATSKISALLSGFTMVVIVELNLNSEPDPEKKIPHRMLIAYTICTTLLVAVHTLAFMMSIYILPYVETMCNLNNVDLIYGLPHNKLRSFVEAPWTLSTGLGLILFSSEMAILSWIKFSSISSVTAWTVCIVFILVICFFIVFSSEFDYIINNHEREISQRIVANDTNSRPLRRESSLDIYIPSDTWTNKIPCPKESWI